MAPVCPPLKREVQAQRDRRGRFLERRHSLLVRTGDHSDQKGQWLFPQNRIFGKSHF
jgi:hypothetical protein